MFRPIHGLTFCSLGKAAECGRLHRFSRWLVVVVLFGYITGAFSCSTYAQQSDSPTEPHKRWAILCSPDLQSKGVSDLLTAKLSTVGNFDLVERDVLEQVEEELIQASFSDPSNIRDRLKIGSLLNADLLAILSTQKSADQEILRVVICECELGTRISDRRTNLTIETRSGQVKKANVESITDMCEAQILRTRKRFANGIQTIVGVPPFQSNNLTHRWDRYQSGFQNLLQSALLAYPGIAVVEIEEARAIKRELARKSDQSLEQSAVILVRGSFEFEPSRVNKEGRSEAAPTVRLHVDLNRKADKHGGNRKASLKSMALNEAKTFLTKTLPKKIVSKDTAQIENPLMFSQLRWLEEQADQFFRRGDWQHSVSLCEAALLLDPNNVGIRRTAFRCYLNICSSVGFDSYTARDSPLDNPRLVADVNKREEAYLTYIEHLEYLIRNRLVSAEEATNWIRTTRGAFASKQGGSSSQYLISRYKEIAARLETAEQSFIRRIKPIVLSLDRDPSYQVKTGTTGLFPAVKEASDLVLAWDHIVFNSARHNMTRGYLTAADLDRIFQIIAEEIPEGRPLLHEYWNFFGSVRAISTELYSGHSKQPDFATPQDWKKLIARLADCGNKNAAIVARFSEMNLKHLRFRSLNRETDTISRDELEKLYDGLKSEVETLYDDYLAIPFSAEFMGRSRSKERIPIEVRAILRDLLKSPSSKLAQQPSAGPSPKLPPGLTKIDYTGAAGVVREYPLRLRSKEKRGRISDGVDLYTPTRFTRERDRKRRTGEVDGAADAPQLSLPERGLRIIPCGKVDVWMTPAKIMVMREKGLLEIVFSDQQAYLLDVLWDGKYAWVSTLYDGIKILDLKKGTLSPPIDQKYGLPPANADLKIIDIAPSEILAVGSFGKKFRAWCAIIKLKGRKPVVDVFHQATDPTTNPAGEPDWRDTNLAFLPEWICRFDPGNGQSEKFLVGRRLDGHHRAHRPLVIDTETRTVSAKMFHAAISSNYSGFLSDRDSFFSLDGTIIRVGQGCVNICEPHFGPETSEAQKKDYGLKLCDAFKGLKFSRGRGPRAITKIYKHVLEDGQIITAGMQWYKLDPKTLEEKRYVSPDPNRVLKVPEDWGVSAHYGLIGWDDDDATSFRQYVLEDYDR